MARCSHNIPLEVKCSKCVKEGLAANATVTPTRPGPDATAAERAAYWADSYKLAHKTPHTY